MKKTILALGVSVLALAAPASAGEGFYMGLGMIYADNDPTVSHRVVSGGAGWFTVANRAAINAAPVDDLTTDSYGAAIFAGYKTHIAEDFMIGIEADANVFDGEAERTHTQNYPNPPGAFTLYQSISQQWISTIRGRLGVDIGPGTVYVTAGAAFTDVETVGRISDTYQNGGDVPPTLNRILLQGARSSELATGFVWGGGLDLGLGGSTTLRIEYLHHDFGAIKGYSRTIQRSGGGGLPFGGETISNTVDMENDTFKIGLAWGLNIM
jgi:opacity protein-like surface antigen